MLNVTLTAEEFEDVGGAPGYEDFVAAMTTTPITPSIKPCVIGTVTHSTPHSSMSSQSASPCTTSKSNTQDGLRTTLTLEAQWPKLIRYVENGAWPIDNNLCENVIRPFVVGRRNWHFADTVAGANASTNLYSLIERSKANGVYRYLVALFKGLSLAKTVDDYEQLLPWHLALGD